MIFEDFQQGIIDRLENDAYFTQSPAVVILPEEDPDEITDEELALIRVRANTALNAGGMVLIVSEVDYAAVEESPDMFELTTTIVGFENRQKNRKEATGCRRSGRDCLAKVHARLQHYTIPFSNSDDERVDPFQPLRISQAEYVGEEEGRSVRGLVIKSQVAIGVIEYALENEDGLFLVTENNQPLESSPHNP